MQKRGLIVVTSLLAFSLAGAIVATSGVTEISRVIANGSDPYVNTITLTASDFAGLSGTLVAKGNTFTYSGITLDGDDIIFAANANLVSAADSGSAGSTNALTGSGFTSFVISPTANYTGDVVLNNEVKAVNLVSGTDYTLAVNSKRFDFVVLGDSVRTDKLQLSYSCLKDEIVIDGFNNEYIWSSDVMSNMIPVKLNDDYKTEVYAYKNSTGLYFYAEQHVKVVKNAGSGWWQHDNLEFRIDSGTAYRHYNMDDNSKVPQRFVSVNGDTTFTQAAHTNPVLNEGTGLYDIHYEMFINWSDLGLIYEDLQIVLIGSNYEGGFIWNNRADYHSERSHYYPVVTSNGFKPYSLDLLGGNELLTAPISGGSDDGWAYRLAQARASTSSNFILNISSHAENGPSHLNDLAAGFVAEFVASTGWGDGGASIRKDWYAWNGLAPDTSVNPNKFDVDNISTLPWGEGGGAAFEEATNAMNVKTVFSFRGHEIDLMVMGTSTYTGHVGQFYYMSMRFKDVSHLPNIDIGVGYNLGSATVTSYKVALGNVAIL